MSVYVFTIDGVVKTIQPNWTITENANGPNRMTFQLLSFDGSYRPADDAEIIFTEDAVRIFAGLIDTPKESGFGGTGASSGIITDESAPDYNIYVSRRLFTGTIPAGTLKAGLIQIASALSVEGVTVDAAQVDGPSLPDLTYADKKIIDILADFSNLSNGWVWNIDYNKKLKATLPASTAAPFNIVDGDGNVDGDITVEKPRASTYANHIIVRYNSSAHSAIGLFGNNGTPNNLNNNDTVTVGSVTYKFESAFTVGGTNNIAIGVNLQDTLFRLAFAIANGAGDGSVIGSGTKSNPSVTAFTIGTNGIEVQAIQPGAAGNSIAVSAVTTSGALWFGEGNVPISTLYLGWDAGPVNRVDANDVPGQAHGLTDATYISDTQDANVAQALANGYLARDSQRPKTITYKAGIGLTGIHPGQIQTITSTKRNLSGNWIITQVVIQSTAGKLVSRTVTATSATIIPATDRENFQKTFGGTSSGSATQAGSVVLTQGTGGSGTVGKLSKWITANTLGDSIISESGSVASVAGTLAATTLTGALAVGSLTGTLAIGSGGTGATTAANALTNLGATGRAAYATTPGASVVAADVRNLIDPSVGIGYAHGMRVRFSALNDDSNLPYADVIDLSTYTDSSGGGYNALYFQKTAQLIKHKWAGAGVTAWTVRTIAYLESPSFITPNIGVATATSLTSGTAVINGAYTTDSSAALTVNSTFSTAVANAYGLLSTLAFTHTTGTMSNAYAGYTQALYSGTSATNPAVTLAVGCQARIGIRSVSPTGVITSGVCFNAGPPTNQATGTPAVTITNQYGLLVNNQGAGTGVNGLIIGNAFGIYIQTQSGTSGANYAFYSQGGTNYFGGLVTSDGSFTFSSAVSLGWGSSLAVQDTTLFRDAAGVLAQRSGVTAQTLRVYGTYTDASNYERLELLGGTTPKLQYAAAGTGSSRVLRIGTATATATTFITNATDRWTIDQNGHLLGATDNSFDIGAGANRPRNLSIAATATIGGNALPAIGFTSNIGSLITKWLSIYASELQVSTLVAQQTLASIGGRVVVPKNTNTLSADLAPTSTIATLKYNSYIGGECVLMESNGSVEWMITHTYATYVKADAPIAYWRLGETESYFQAIHADAPVGYWRLADATDSLNSHTLTIHTGVTTGQTPLIAVDTASAFDGTTNAYLSRASEAALQIVGDLTVEFWINTSSLAASQRIISKGHTGEFEVYINTSGNIVVAHGDNTTFVTFTSTGTISTNAIYHVVVVRDATAKTYTFWINAILAGTSTYTTPVPTASVNAFQIGSSPTLAGPLTGTLDEAALYNAKLSAGQITNHYALRTSLLVSTAALTAVDIGPNGLTGNYVLGTTLGQSGAIPRDTDKAVLFDGTSGYVQVPNAAALQIVGDLTIELWVKFTSLATRQTLVTKQSGHEFELTVETTGQINLYQGNATDGTVNVSSNAGALTVGPWYHLLVTRVASTRTISFYINGVLNRSGAYAGTNPIQTSTNEVRIGKASAGGQYVTGYLDDVSIYASALSGTQATNHYALGHDAGATNAYLYGLTRNLDGTGANQWYAGDAVMNTGTTGDGYVDIYAATGTINGIGPSIVGNVRTGLAYNSIEPRWALGNLNGLYGYGVTTYGVAMGVPTGAWVKIDSINGVRLGFNVTTNVQIDATGNATFAGALVAATGSFAGSLSAATGTFAGSLSAATGSFSGTVTATTGTIAGWSLQTTGLVKDTGTNATSSGMAPADYPFYAGATYANRATAPFRVTPAGAIVAASGTVGGWTIGATTLNIDTGTNSTSSGMSASDYPFYAGATYANRATAPFRITPDGSIVATSVTLSGNLTVGTSGVIKSGATAFGTTTGYWLDYNAGSPRFRVGNPAGDRLSWDGSTLLIRSGKLLIDGSSSGHIGMGASPYSIATLNIAADTNTSTSMSFLASSNDGSLISLICYGDGSVYLGNLLYIMAGTWSTIGSGNNAGLTANGPFGSGIQPTGWMRYFINTGSAYFQAWLPVWLG